MAMDGGNPNNGFQSEINVTPLVDVVLVLLIIFMVIVPLTMRGYDVDIPGETIVSAESEKADEQFVLTIGVADCPVVEPPQDQGLPSDCRVRINDEDLAIADLAGRVTELFSRRPEPVLFLAADEELNYEGVMRIIDVARSGVDGLRIGMVTDGEPVSTFPPPS
jgi:biopolymer transport protein ExbD